MKRYNHPFGEWAKSVQQRFAYEYNASASVVDQAVLLGTIREAIVGNILRSFLPLSLDIGTGQIVDNLGNRSKQIDIFIADDACPVFRFDGGVSAFLCETVLATIEVKSMLYANKLHEALDNCASVRELAYNLHIIGKGKQIFDDAFRWIESNGGLEEIENKIHNPSGPNTLGCPEDIWELTSFVRFWQH